jgi:branched-chain amino acid transport system substrate-binding protein
MTMSSSSLPLRIGYCLSLTGPLSGNSRSAQLAHEIWRDDVNSRGGLLGRQVALVCYDDEGDASRVAALYARLIDEDRVDLVIGGYGTNTNLPALPEIASRQLFFVGLMALGANNELNYPNYFAMIPTGSDPTAISPANNRGATLGRCSFFTKPNPRRQGECSKARFRDCP